MSTSSEEQQPSLIPQAKQAAQRAARRENISVTDVHNRALQFYDFILEVTSQGAELLLRKPDGSETIVEIL